MKLKIAILLALALLAFTVPSLATFSLSPTKLCNLSYSFADDGDSPPQPEGDPVEGGGFPH